MKFTSVGYTGGSSPKPTYQTVCRGDGHTEALKIDYDPGTTTYQELLDMFWSLYRGSDNFSEQYKTAIWYHNEEQREEIVKSMEKVKEKLGSYPDIDILPASTWHDAEDYHQKYMEKMRERSMGAMSSM